MSKRLGYLSLSVLFFLLVSRASSHAMMCVDIFSNGVSPNPQSLASLFEKVEPLNVQLRLSRDFSYDELRELYFEIAAVDIEGHVVGTVIMTPEHVPIVVEGQERSLYTVDIYTNDQPDRSMVGTGLGTYLYVAAARVIHRLDGVLFSSTVPVDEAVAAWERMVGNGWAVRGHERDDLLSSLEGAPSSYRFHQGLLESGFFNAMDTRVEDPEDLLVPE